MPDPQPPYKPFKDYGDRFPSDYGDTKPVAPTYGYSEDTTKRIGKADPRIQRSDTEFDNQSDIDEPISNPRLSWTGTVIENLGDGLYEVMLQDGTDVNARDIWEIPNYEFLPNQTVSVFAGARGDTYTLTGQKFPVRPQIRYAKLTEILEVGKSALATVLLDAGNGTFDLTTDEVELHDPHDLNYGLINEILPFTYDSVVQTATILGSQGLMRLGKASGGITAGSSGTVQIWDSVGAVTDATVTAYLTWMHNSENMTGGKEVIIKYFPEHGKWIIIGRECE